WNAKYRSSGIVSEYPGFGALPTLFSPKSSRLPMNALKGGPRASVYPHRAQTRLTTTKMAKHWAIVETRFFLRTSPPEKKPRAGVMIMTRAVAAMTHAMSPESSAKFRSPPKRSSAGNPTRRITLRVRRFGSSWIRARRGWGPNRGLGEQLDPDSVRVCDVRPPAGRRLHVEDDGVARLLRLRERLVEVLDLERQVVESFADDVVRREAAAPFRSG